MSFELTNTDHAILTLLTDGDCSVAELVEFTGESRERIEDRVDAMQDRGYVQRVPDTPPRIELVNDPR